MAPQAEAGKIYVGKLGPNVDEAALRAHFGNFGTVSDCVVKKDYTHGHPIFAFVTFAEASSAEAVKSFGQHMIGDKEVEVKDAFAQQAGQTAHDTQSDPKKVFVGGLKPDTKEDEIHAFFSTFGPISTVDLKMRPDDPSKSRGFCFVTFVDESTVGAVMDAHATNKIGDKWVDVKRTDGTQQANPKGAFIGGLTAGVTEEALSAYFSNFGAVVKCDVKKDVAGNVRGFAFVHFDTQEAAKSALEFTAHELDGKKIEVKPLVPPSTGWQERKGGKGKGKGMGKGGMMMMSPWMGSSWGGSGGWGSGWGGSSGWGSGWGTSGGWGAASWSRSSPY